MSQLHLTATVAAGIILGVFGIANYLLEGRPFHAPIPTAYWGDEQSNEGGENFITLEDVAPKSGTQPVAHTTP